MSGTSIILLIENFETLALTLVSCNVSVGFLAILFRFNMCNGVSLCTVASPEYLPIYI